MAAEFEVTLPGLEAEVICRELPAWRFLEGMPVDGEGVAEERWIDALLTRAIVEPPLTVEQVCRLGADRDHLVRTYLRAVGWLEDQPAAVTLQPPGDHAAPAATLPMRAPAPGLRRIVRVMAERWQVPPAQLLELPTSAFVVNLRLLRDEDDHADDPRRVLSADDYSGDIPADRIWSAMDRR